LNANQQSAFMTQQYIGWSHYTKREKDEDFSAWHKLC
jgi:hypothetical protein